MASHPIVTHDRDGDGESKRRKTKASQPQSSWSDLPQDILGLVVQRLYISDRLRLRAVCKKWGLPPCFDKLPLLLNYSMSPYRIICSLFDPYHKIPYTVQKERRWTPEGSFLYGATACASRCGWVLFHENITRVYNSQHQYCVYNSHTKALISLPILELPKHAQYFEVHPANFSSSPTSADCMFVVPITCCFGSEDFFINTYSIGDRTWKTHNFPYPSHFYRYGHMSAYMEGSFYFYDGLGNLSSFHIGSQTWNLISENCPAWSGMKSRKMKWCYFVAYGGHLYIVYLREKVNRAPKCNIFRHDLVDGKWKKMESLEGGALFLGKHSFGVSAEEESKMVANRVYYMSSASSKPSFLLYGSAGAGMEEKSESESESFPWRWTEKSESSVESTSWMWMEPTTR